ncbi:hypothetical protein G9A89_010988 [Geosiphon pyriformis]|nr:hypothetical protein G9A89_010988 [Geosiphon pyriformis]
MEQLEPQQQTQLKELIAEFADIFTENNNDLERTDLKVDTGKLPWIPKTAPKQHSQHKEETTNSM